MDRLMTSWPLPYQRSTLPLSYRSDGRLNNRRRLELQGVAAAFNTLRRFGSTLPVWQQTGSVHAPAYTGPARATPFLLPIRCQFGRGSK
jgi:hypothetical protein